MLFITYVNLTAVQGLLTCNLLYVHGIGKGLQIADDVKNATHMQSNHVCKDLAFKGVCLAFKSCEYNKYY